MSISIARAITQAAAVLAAAGVNQPQIEASLLLSDLLGRDRAFLMAHSNEYLPNDQDEEFQSRVARRVNGEPPQYITGHQQFFKLDFEVTPDVLIPRPDTELIVEAALELVDWNAPINFADIGTGSGCIAVSLLNELLNAHAVAVDISPAALAVALRNAERHRVGERLRLIESDAFVSIDPTELFDLIVSNPPYVSDVDMRSLQREVRYEPASALAGGADGFDVIRRLLKDARRFLQSGGHFIFEIGFGQGEKIKELIDPAMWELIEIRRDLAKIPRTVVLRKRN